MPKLIYDFNLFKYSASFIAAIPFNREKITSFSKQFLNDIKPKSPPEDIKKNFASKDYFRLRNKYTYSDSLRRSAYFNYLREPLLKNWFQTNYISTVKKFASEEKLEELEKKTFSTLGYTKPIPYQVYIDLFAPYKTAANYTKLKNIIYLGLKNDYEIHWNGFIHELIHLILKQLKTPKVKKLAAPVNYREDQPETIFNEYLTICLTILVNPPASLDKNLTLYEERGFQSIKDFYQEVSKIMSNNTLSQETINQIAAR